jgi:hypothetical protein
MECLSIQPSLSAPIPERSLPPESMIRVQELDQRIQRIAGALCGLDRARFILAAGASSGDTTLFSSVKEALLRDGLGDHRGSREVVKCTCYGELLQKIDMVSWYLHKEQEEVQSLIADVLQPFPLLQLPPDLLRNVLEQAPGKTRATVALVSRAFCDLSLDATSQECTKYIKEKIQVFIDALKQPEPYQLEVHNVEEQTSAIEELQKIRDSFFLATSSGCQSNFNELLGQIRTIRDSVSSILARLSVLYSLRPKYANWYASSAARSTFSEILEMAMCQQRRPDYLNVPTIQNLVNRKSEVGEYTFAMELAELLFFEKFERESAFRTIATAMGEKGDIDEALALVGQITHKKLSNDTLSDISHRLQQKGEALKAIPITYAISDKSQQDLVLEGLVPTLAEDGHFQEAYEAIRNISDRRKQESISRAVHIVEERRSKARSLPCTLADIQQFQTENNQHFFELLMICQYGRDSGTSRKCLADLKDRGFLLEDGTVRCDIKPLVLTHVSSTMPSMELLLSEAERLWREKSNGVLRA